jgi:hypothetical protein
MGDHKKYPVGSYGWKRRVNRGGRRKPFVGVDGEGGTDSSGRHRYYYLRAGRRELYNSDGSPLSTGQCLAFIAGLPGDATYVGFFFDYDVTKILSELSLERVGRLLHPKSFIGRDGKSHTSYTDWQDFQITYRPGKEFRVRQRDGQWVTINDVGSFFQCTFVKALTEWLGEWDGHSYVIRDERDRRIIDLIASGKEQRNEFTGLTDYIREYCRLEVEQLARLMETFRANCDALGLRPTRWQGPGYLVSSAMKNNKFPKRTEYEDNVPKRVWEMAQAAYYGGRFEAPIVGHITRPVHQYDINSAYAASYRRLPCLIHGEWNRYDPSGDVFPILAIGHFSFSHDRADSLCSLPRRSREGRISFPERGNGYYWMHEVNNRERHCQADLDEVWGYTSHCECKPFAWVDALYSKRIEVGKKSGLGGVLKLVLASTYGKLCQSVGTPQYSNPVWASLITSYVRTWLYEAAMQDGRDGSDVIMLATDGLFTLEPRRLPISSEIGEWEHDVHDGMFVIQSGLYFLPNSKVKSRGIPAKHIEGRRDDIQHAWSEYHARVSQAFLPGRIDLPSIPIRQRRFISLSQGYAWNDMSRAGEWPEDDRSLSFDFKSKRAVSAFSLDIFDGAIRTVPIRGNRHEENHPYQRSIGGILNEEDKTSRRIFDEGQPDWNFFQL